MNFPGVKNASVNYLLNLENRQAIIDYIVSEKTINPSADSNWYFTDSIANLDLRFLSAEKAKDLIGMPTISHILELPVLEALVTSNSLTSNQPLLFQLLILSLNQRFQKKNVKTSISL